MSLLVGTLHMLTAALIEDASGRALHHVGSAEQAKTLPGVAETDAARNNRIYKVPEHDLMYFGPDTGESIVRLAQIIHQ